MKKNFFLFVALICIARAQAQNLGIGTTSPLMTLHISSGSDSGALFENTKPLNTNVSNALYFKTGSGVYQYTGAIKTIGQNTKAARIGFFTSASLLAQGLQERLSILDNGKVGIGTNSPDSNLTVVGSTNILGTIKTINFKMATGAGANKILQSDASGNARWVTPAASGSHTLGESYGGGIVFYIYDGGLHGLIAATTDQSASIRWCGGSYTFTRARADGIGAGLKNTAIIIANQGPVDGNSFAATVCNEYSVTVAGVTYGDWYLPSKYELNLLYLQRNVVGGFAGGFYWSSSENDYDVAWGQYFYDGSNYRTDKYTPTSVRAVRAF